MPKRANPESPALRCCVCRSVLRLGKVFTFSRWPSDGTRKRKPWMYACSQTCAEREQERRLAEAIFSTHNASGEGRKPAPERTA